MLFWTGLGVFIVCVAAIAFIAWSLNRTRRSK